MITKEDIFSYVENTYQTKPEYLWSRFPSYAVLRQLSNNKWYAIVMNVAKEKLKLTENGTIDILNIKLPPELIGALRQSNGFLPAYHMNKEHWITILLNGSVTKEEVYHLIDTSFHLTKK